jgi:UDP-N-acetylmuramate--alanine ligase
MKIHFIGIGGIGMSALADVYLTAGSRVTGSDLRSNNLTEELCVKGAAIYEGHRAQNLPGDTDLAVRTTCIRDDNPEILRAGELGIPVIHRSELLQRVMEDTPVSIAVTGTHGKTTTSALMAYMAEFCGKDPTVLIGGEMDHFGSNAKTGKGKTVVAELDESDGYFRNISVHSAVVTNVEREHMEHFGSFDNLVAAYEEFISRISASGALVFNGEDELLTRLANSCPAEKISYGIDGDFDVTCRDFSCSKAIDLELIVKGKSYGRLASPLIGRYNLMNILGAAGLGIRLGYDMKGIAAAVRAFRGVKRRFETIGSVGDIKVIEDYAHHPTEVSAVIRAAKDFNAGRVIGIFQPHRHSRTNDLAKEFTDCFNDSDVLILTDVYSADEDPLEGVSIRDIYNRMDRGRFELLDFVKKEEIPGYVSRIVKEGDMVLVLGAGDIRDISKPLVSEIEKLWTRQ